LYVRGPEAPSIEVRAEIVMTGRVAAKLLHEWLREARDFRKGPVSELLERTRSALEESPWTTPRSPQRARNPWWSWFASHPRPAP
jgi:uracil-DNA glycosylase